MRFIIGLLLGFGAGFAGAVLFAPDRQTKNEVEWNAAVGASPNGIGQNHNAAGALRRALRSLQDQINDAMSEAKQASQETETEMRARYEKAAGKRSAKTNAGKK